MLALAAAFALAACARIERPPVAPFGGELAAPLPSRDVLGFCRFLPDDPRVALRLAQLDPGDGEADAGHGRRSLSIAGPTVTVLGMLEESGFVAADQPFAIVLLDASVHGAIAGFAWRGDGVAFRAAARARGLAMPEPDRIELPGRGQVEEFEVLSDMNLSGTDAHPAPHVDYHLVERHGLTLLLPARDGVRNVLAALERTHALDPGASGLCFRIEFGPVAEKVRDVTRQLASMQVGRLVDGLLTDPRMEERSVRAESRRRGGNFDEWQLQNTLRDVVDALLDLCGSIEHLFVQVDDERAELYLRAADDGFFRNLLPLARNVPLAELLAGTPPDAEFVMAASCDPKTLAGIEPIWEASKQGFFKRRRRHRFVDDSDVSEPEPAFIDSFGGRIWIAVAETKADALSARIFAQLVDEETNVGPTTALAKLALPSGKFEGVQAASLALYAVSRVPDGCIEVIGAQPNALLAAERRRLESAAAPRLPDDAPPEAFLCVIGRIPGFEPGVLTCTRDRDGIRVHFTLPPR